MYKKFKVSLLLLLGGKGSRFKSDTPKQFHMLAGKKIYLHTLDTFYNLNIFDELIIVTHRDWIKTVEKETCIYKNIKVIQGGKERQESSYLGLKAIKTTDFVMFHDAVRPFVTKKIILDNLDTVIKYRAVNTCIKSTDTLVEIDDQNKISKVVDRSKLYRGQTPQTFEYNLILDAHVEALKNGITNATDDCQLVMKKTKVHIVEGSSNNIKITTKSDLLLADFLFGLKKDQISIKTKKSLQNKIFAVVGATGGIGKEVVKLLKKEKAIVLEISRSSTYKTDIEDVNSIQKTFDKIYKEYGNIDGLINAAGFFLVKPFKKVSNEEIEKLIKVNLLGLIYSCKEAKIKKNGHIINISSSSYLVGRKNYGIYSATKAAVVNFTQSLSQELLDLKINTIAPQRTDTPMRKEYFPNEDKNLLLDPKEVSKKIIGILKDDSYSGSIIKVKK
ncbi:MAG: 2-C-methyl-D-erythritol 4-phosphate cytidylyltransferase 2 [Candidatus Anoxychlamydiales bacterium]|nr:2-C-methyl-D-erythritol 4-phosphate cytidylyltransferase 2 [Candidatus Anoxychlamydiales bacterium]NGX35485.1 2-C-methyl-D-erythritol 4-phosphate cytidylyltransferase 2 [Candidatus Anoxychlamydiales bacterium]